MASIWLSLDQVPPDDFVSSIVIPMGRALREKGINPNLESTTNHIYQNEGTLEYALFPGGTLSFVYTTGPTHNIISGDIDTSRYMMATIQEIPTGAGITDEDVNNAIQLFQSNLAENGIYGWPRVTEGGSIKGKLKPEIHRQRQVQAPVSRSETVPTGSTPTAHSSTTTAQPGTPTTQKKGCYIATAVYGDYNAPQVRTLRRFRDLKLAQTSTGRTLIRLYYRLSPTLVHHLGDRAWARRLSRPLLNALARRLQANGFSDASYRDPEA